MYLMRVQQATHMRVQQATHRDDVTCVYDDVTYVCDDVTCVQQATHRDDSWHQLTNYCMYEYVIIKTIIINQQQ
jgi:hypothetical protein